jgi:hypothetical protein
MANAKRSTSTKTTPAPVAAPAPVAPVAAPAPVAVALRGGLAVVAVKLAGHPYRTSAAHTAANWQTIVAACTAAPGGVVPVASLLPPAQHAATAASHKANGGGAWVPSHFVGYCLRRGYLVAVQPAAPTA